MSSFRRGARKPYARPTEPRGDADAQWVHDKAPTGPRADQGRSKAVAIPAAIVSANSKLLVSNLHYEITPKDLTSIFGQIGTLGTASPELHLKKANLDSIAYSHSVFASPLKYDRSGRSSGTAIISFETATEATRAKKQFDGILARGTVPSRACHGPFPGRVLRICTPTDLRVSGQPMTITFDTLPPRQPRRSASVPTSLINRIQKPPLLDRLSRDDSSVKTPSGPRGGVGPVRTRPARGGAAAAPRAPRAPKKPKTAEELDQELDAFMGDSEPTAPAAEKSAPAEAELVAQDVEMA
ncbi:hypothetical protein DXG01_000349 [Tephrocybe rancida]|nr:hypothetical protein DXG01_000349 [Tephrocybe rancida]